MKEPRKYATGDALRGALEARLKRIAEDEGGDLQRLRKQVAFDRFLARLFSDPSSPWVLKGGYAMELRIKQARTTRDIDLVMKRGSVAGVAGGESLRDQLQDFADRDLGDHFDFEIGKSMMDPEAAPYGGWRYPVDAEMADRTFVKFHLDLAVGDLVLEPLTTAQGRDWLGFAGISAASFPALSPEQHLAEKIHAYTVPRKTPNTRVRDLVDMVLLIQGGTLDRSLFKEALSAVFDRRKTHPVPETLEPPPEQWSAPFRDLARGCGIEEEIGSAFQQVLRFLKSMT